MAAVGLLALCCCSAALTAAEPLAAPCAAGGGEACDAVEEEVSALAQLNIRRLNDERAAQYPSLYSPEYSQGDMWQAQGGAAAAAYPMSPFAAGVQEGVGELFKALAQASMEAPDDDKEGTARTMQQAMAVLQPLLAAKGGEDVTSMLHNAIKELMSLDLNATAGMDLSEEVLPIDASEEEAADAKSEEKAVSKILDWFSDSMSSAPKLPDVPQGMGPAKQKAGTQSLNHIAKQFLKGRATKSHR